MTRQGAIISVLLSAGLAGCATTQPPERLVAVTAELAQPEAQELAEFHQSYMREARDHRDAGWEAVNRGNADMAELHAWVSWLRLRTVENLEAVMQADALEQAELAAGEVVGSTPPNAVPGQRRGDRRGRHDARQVDAEIAVREAENAKLRLLTAGLEPDVRWAEADALLLMAQRALDRGDLDRAQELGDRAAFVFEVVRLTRLGDIGAPIVSAPTGTDELASAAQRELPADTGDTPVSQVATAPSEAVPTVALGPGATVTAAEAEVESTEETSEPPRSRIISNILQPVDD